MDNLKNIFKEHFHCDPQYAIRCPGRVNLIGEHTDYSGYGVLPMAVAVSTHILISWGNANEISFANTDSAFPTGTHKLHDDWIGKPIKWYYYFLCGWKGIIEHLKLKPRGMNVLLSGSIPQSSGLSSSSSIVCAAALATMVLHTNKAFEILSRANLAELCAKIERYIGTEGGGMDQAIEILGKSGCAMMIDFNPLRYEEVKLPEGALFGVLHCGATLTKSMTSHYNERVVECRIAAQVIAKLNGVTKWKEIRTLKQVADTLQKDANEMLPVVKATLTKSLYSREFILKILEIQDEDFAQLSLSTNTQKMTEFKLQQRATHVYSEASRVVLFRNACKSGNIEELGRLMNESHASCRDMYECSCKELNETVERCLSHGALAARLTGAGWGGCVIALFREVQKNFDVLFWSEPSAGIEAIKC